LWIADCQWKLVPPSTIAPRFFSGERVPVTVKLSERFYQKFGHELVDEMVNWLNQVDATYRSDLREINELNFSRFDAKLEQRLAQSDAQWEQRLAQSDAKWERRLAQFDVKWEQRFAGLEVKLEAQGRMLLKWMVMCALCASAVAIMWTMGFTLRGAGAPALGLFVLGTAGQMYAVSRM